MMLTTKAKASGFRQRMAPLLLAIPLLPFSAVQAAYLFQEDFESANWYNAHGWYDADTPPTVSTSEAYGGQRSLAYSFDQGQVSSYGLRQPLPNLGTVYLQFARKYDPNWQWPNLGPHDFYVFAGATPYIAPTTTPLTAYFEESGGVANTGLRAALQNGSPYQNDWYYEAADSPSLTNGQWHIVDAMVKMNTPGMANGEMRMWVDGVLQVERTGLLLRAENYENLTFNQLFFGPFIHNGAPQAQTFWTDNIIISDTPIAPGAPVPLPLPVLFLGSGLLGLLCRARRR